MPDVELAPDPPPETFPDAGPVPLSFPAILRNATLSDRFAHLHLSSQDPARSHHRKIKKERAEPEGKRWVRRRENAKFVHNPHVVLPTGSADLAHPLQVPLSTFPHPLPSYLPRTLVLPPSRPPPTLPSTSSAGLFSLSLRGVRRALRARPSSASLVKAIEAHISTWLLGGTYWNPDQAKDTLSFPGDPVGGREDIREVCREAGRLVWAVKATECPDHTDGGFERYVVHCVARWYGVISFSKERDGHRLTYLLRPNITRPDPRFPASQTLDTPPATDGSDFHVSDASLSDYNTTDASDVDSAAGDLADTRSLSDIQESRPLSPASWSVVGGSDFAIDSENDTDERGFAASVESLSLSVHAEQDDESVAPDTTLTPSRARLDRDHLRTLYPRSTSSPSPARRSSLRLTARKLGARRRKAKNDNKVLAGAIGNKSSFYDYLFS